MNQVVEFFRGLFDTALWPPRWHCGTWTDFHGWLYILSDLMIWLAYFLIPLIIINYFNSKKARIRFQKVYLLFAAFILLCGTTHFLDAMMFWTPMYRFNALVRFATGVVSLFTVYHLIKVLPELSRQRTSMELEKEIVLREETEKKLSEANRQLAAFASMASHDLKEPARKIRTFAGLVYSKNENSFDSESRLNMQKIMASADRMQELIRDVLSLSTISDTVEFSKIQVEEAVTRAMESLELTIAEKNARIIVGELPEVRGNLDYLTQVFFNLIANGIKFNDRQPVIEITGQQLGDEIRIQVRDNGIGLQPDQIRKIFEPFVRMHPKSKYEGTGIGLAICQRIMEVHSGRIEAESVPGIGTAFILVFPDK